MVAAYYRGINARGSNLAGPRSCKANGHTKGDAKPAPRAGVRNPMSPHYCIFTGMALHDSEVRDLKRSLSQRAFQDAGGQACASVGQCGATGKFIGLAYRPELDGLRALAIIPVVSFHFKLGPPGGYAGVDVFFVISGYLICCIQLGKLAKGTFSFSNFFERRTRRLFPALAFMLACTLTAGWHDFWPQTFRGVLNQALAVLLVGANFHFLGKAGGYFQQTKLEQPLLHCWSLAVEEQFYIVFPILIRLAWTRRHRASSITFWMLCIIFIASLVLSISMAGSMFSFYMLPTRAWEMTFGALLAYDRGSSIFVRNRAAAEIGAWAGMVLIVSSYFALNEHSPYPSHRALLPCCGTVLFIASQRKHLALCGKFFASPVPVFIGKASYSLYLWHWPVYVLLANRSVTGELSRGGTATGLAVSIALSAISYLWVEPAFRSPKKGSLFASSRIFMISAVAAWLALLLFTVIAANRGLGGFRAGAPVALPGTQHSDARCSGFAFPVCTYTSSSTGANCSVFLNVTQIDALYTVGTDRVHLGNIMDSTATVDPHPWGIYFRNNVLGRGTAPPTIAAIGSSHCAMWGPELEHLANEYGVRIVFMCETGISAIDANTKALIMERLDYWGSVQQVIWADYWGFERLTPAAQYFWGAAMDDSTFARVAYEMAQALSARVSRILVLGDIPSLAHPTGVIVENPKYWAANHLRASSDKSFIFSLQEVGCKYPDQNPGCRSNRLGFEAILRTIADTRVDMMKFVEVASYFHPSQILDPATGRIVYLDHNHLNADGARRIGQLLRREVFEYAGCNSSTALIEGRKPCLCD